MMESRKHCLYNQPRESFLSHGVVMADSPTLQLKALLEDFSIMPDCGLWLSPFRGIPATKGLTPVDLIYLDENNRVIQAVESFPNHAIEPTREQPSSALILAGRTIFSSQTQTGDTLMICYADEMEGRLGSSNGRGHSSAQMARAIRSDSSQTMVAEPPPEVDRPTELLAVY